MNRAIHRALRLGLLALAVTVAPGQQDPPAESVQPDPIEGIVAEMRQAEERLKSIRVELETRGVYPNGLSFSTKGTLHVLRGEQQRTRATLRMRFADDLESQMDSAQSERGVTIYKDDPAFGEIYLQVSPTIVGDLEWAGEVLGRADLPGMRDARAAAPLGSSMLDGLRREFALAITDQTQRGSDAGVWLRGERRPGLGDVDIELPIANRVEAFVRAADHALLEVVHYQGDAELQRIVVQKLEVDVEIPPTTFVVDGRGQQLRDVERYVPLWTLIQDVVARAEAKLRPKDLKPDEASPPEAVRPSKRK